MNRMQHLSLILPVPYNLKIEILVTIVDESKKSNHECRPMRAVSSLNSRMRGRDPTHERDHFHREVCLPAKQNDIKTHNQKNEHKPLDHDRQPFDCAYVPNLEQTY